MHFNRCLQRTGDQNLLKKYLFFSFLYFPNLPVILLPLHPKNLQRRKMLFMACVPLDAKIDRSEHVYLWKFPLCVIFAAVIMAVV